MPQSEADLYAHVVDINRRATYARSLWTNYGYNAILGVNLVDRCMSLRSLFPPPIRVLDVGCGEGLALAQLAEGIVRAGGRAEDFELWGLGLNEYETMKIPPERFIRGGLNGHAKTNLSFHLVVSVFAFHYMWHKLEGIERIYNEMLADGGFAYLHFPGYLVRFGESADTLDKTEEQGNREFSEFLADAVRTKAVTPVKYDLIPHNTDDDDCVALAEFGRLSFSRESQTPMNFGRTLTAFSLFSQGFRFARMNGRLTYVASHYVASTSDSMALPLSRLQSLHHTVAERELRIDLAVHAHAGERILLLCPGAGQPLHGNSMLEEIMLGIQDSNLGAVVRYGDPYDDKGNYSEVLLSSLRLMLKFILEDAAEMCSTPTPRIGVIAYSSSGGAIASLAAEFPAIDTLLLIAPSFDVPRATIEAPLRGFAGRVHVLIGEEDEVVLPQQAFWFYENAGRASHREYVEVSSCGHDFVRPHCRKLLRRAAEWALGERRPPSFPPPRETYSESL